MDIKKVSMFDSLRPLHFKQGGLLIASTQTHLSTPGTTPIFEKEKRKQKKKAVSCLVLIRAFGPDEGNTPFMASFMRNFLAQVESRVFLYRLGFQRKQGNNV